MRIAASIGTIIAALLLGAMPAGAATRVALVIGNSVYQHVPLLPNPVNDAADLSASLKRLDFDVRTVTNARYDDMRRALIDFSQKASGAEIAVIFFAGHGVQIDGENWLIPVDAQLATDLNVANETIGLQSLTRAVSSTSRLGLVVLDACRNNPFLPKMQGKKLSRAVDRGFSRVEPSDNVLVAYAARDGTTAADGSGRNSPFTQSLLKNIETPGLEITFMFRNVRDDVMASTRREQQPFIYGSLSREMIYLKPPAATPPAGDGPKTANIAPPAAAPCAPYPAHVETKSVVHTTPTVTVNVTYLDASPGCKIANVEYKVVRSSNFSNLKIAYEEDRAKAKVTYNLADRPSAGFARIEFVVKQEKRL